MRSNQVKLITVLSVLLAVALAVVSYFGAFVPATYERDAPSMAAQGMGQDLVNLFFVTPMLVITFLFMLKKSRIACFIYTGTLFYILYSFVIYAFGVHFNRLFLLYCLILGISFYTFILILDILNKAEIQNWFVEKVPVRSVGFYLIIIAGLFYLLWLGDIIPATITNTIPKSVRDYNLLVNHVHVLDLAIALPGLVISAILLMKKRQLGYILAPVFLVFTIILALALTGMVVMVKSKGISDDTSIAAIFIILAIISTILLVIFLKNVNRNTANSKPL